MQRNKPPALTSPWKIGFFVSLQLVALSIGVAFFLTRSFDVAWSWIAFPDGSWQSPAFDMDGFMREMLPLVVVVPLFSLISYFLITGAVRKYKAYLDSGLDYKNLVKSIRKIEDLDDENHIKKLSNHPELRDFLLNLKRRISEREESFQEREHALEAQLARVDDSESLKADVNVLLSAITAGRDGFGKELALSDDRIRRIETAIRNNLTSAADTAQTNLNAALADARDALAGEGRALEAQLHDVRSELASCLDTARELEEQSTKIRGSIGSSGGGDNAAAAQALAGMDAIAQSLVELGEQAKGIAINAATQASTSGNTEVVTFAEQLREVASGFKQSAQEWAAASATARASMESAPEAGSGQDAVDTLCRAISLWVERSVVLSDKPRTYERAQAESISTLTVKLGGQATVSDPEPGLDNAGFSADESDGFERQVATPVLDEKREAAELDIEKDPDPIQRMEQADTDDTEMFDEVPADRVADVPPQAAEAAAQDEEFEEVTPPEPAQPVAAAEAAAPNEYVIDEDPGETDYASAVEEAESSAEDDGFVTDPAVSPPEEAAVAPSDSEDEVPAFQSKTVDADEDDDVIDLYALGAVDYVAGGAQ